MAANFSASQYAQALGSLLPKGRVWNHSVVDGSDQAALIAGLAEIYEQNDSDAIQLLVDAFPATTVALLGEWNSSVGIPDQCFGAPSSIEQNQQQIVAKLTATGGQSIAYFESLAAAVGLNINITEFSASAPGTLAPTGMITQPSDWSYTFQVNVDRNSLSFFNATSNVITMLASQSMQVFNCLMNRFKPAHTQFYYVFFTSVPSRLLNVSDAVEEPLSIIT